MIFPNITFTCNGSITKLIIGVDISKLPRKATDPEVQIWRKSHNESNSYIKIESVPLINATQMNLNIIELVPPTPMRFQEGDILGVYQPRLSKSMLSIRYQIRDGPINYMVRRQDSALSSFSLTDHETKYKLLYNYPLVTVEISSGINLYFRIKYKCKYNK